MATQLTTDMDLVVTLYVSSIPGSSNLISMLTVGITSLGDVVTLVIISIVLSIIRRTRRQGLILLITILLTVILLTYIKPIVARENPDYPSPFLLSNNTGFVIEEDTLSPLSRDYSYPSNHVAISTAFAFIVGYSLNKRSRMGGWLIWGFPLIVSLTRVLLIQHYVTDVIGGFLFGLIVSIIMSNIMHLEREASTVKSR